MHLKRPFPATAVFLTIPSVDARHLVTNTHDIVYNETIHDTSADVCGG